MIESTFTSGSFWLLCGHVLSINRRNGYKSGSNVTNGWFFNILEKQTCGNGFLINFETSSTYKNFDVP